MRAVQAQEAKQGATALLAALGASVRPLVAQAVKVPPSVTPGPVAGSVYAQLRQRVAAMDAQGDAHQDGLGLG